MTYYLEENEFEGLFSGMKPIIRKLMKQIRIKAWDIEDYYQEEIGRASCRERV